MTPVKNYIEQPPANKRPPANGDDPAERTTARPQRVTLDELDTAWHPLVKTAVAAARAWASRKIGGIENASLVLVASPVMLPDGTHDIDRTGHGVGKTHIAKAMQWASYIHVDGEPVAPAGHFHTASELMALLADNGNLHQFIPTGTDTIYGRVGGCPVVVIDDVGTEGVLQFVAKESQESERHARYFRLINHCYQHKVSVVITANMTLNKLARHIGGRSWSRLMEMAPAGFMVDMTGVPDYRRKTGGR